MDAVASELVLRMIDASARRKSSSVLPIASAPYGELEAAARNKSAILVGTAIGTP
jgi:hypothetical protein